MTKNYQVQAMCFTFAWKNILLHLWIMRLAKTFVWSQQHVLASALDVLKVVLEWVEKVGDVCPVLCLGPFAMGEIVSISLFSDYGMVGITLAEVAWSFCY